MDKEAGVTLIELIIFGSIAAVLGMLFSQYLIKPGQMTAQLIHSNASQPGLRACDQFVTDLREADPVSIPWNTLSPNGTHYTEISFAKQAYDPATGAPLAPENIQYLYQPSTLISGSLVRIDNGTTTVILANVDAPNANAPLVQESDAGSAAGKMIQIMLLYQPPNCPVYRLIRKVAVRS